MVTFNKISTGTLSAISANLGTVTAGSIYGVYINGVTIEGATITGGTINTSSGISIGANGIAIPLGTVAQGRGIRWGTSTYLESDDEGTLYCGPHFVTQGGIASIGSGAYVDCDDWIYAQGALGCGGALTVGGQATFNGGMRWSSPDSQNAGIGQPLVVASDGYIHRATNGVSGSYAGGTFTFENGICTGHS